MKLILYIVISSFVVHRTTNAFGDEKYRLLQPSDDSETELIDDSFTGTFQSYNFISGYPIPVDPTSVDLIGKTLSSPFIVTATFKSYTGTSSCLFSIQEGDAIVLRLCIEPAGRNLARITLNTKLYSPNDSILYIIKDNFKNKWFNVVVFVKDDTASLYVNCSKQQDLTTLTRLPDVLLTKDMKINLAFSLSSRHKFKGAIEEVSLYTNANEDTLESICNSLGMTTPKTLGSPEVSDRTTTEPTTVPVLLAPEKGEKGMKGEKGEIGQKGIKGEKGDRGDTGQKGDFGPQGPIGSVGPIGKKGEEGACKCSEELVSSLLLSMPEMKGPVGDRGLPGYDGQLGPPGSTGNIGPQGERGPQGLKGEIGERGDDGAPGRDGAVGPKGEPGKDGAPGSPGVQGLVGPQGPPGPIYVETEEEKNARIIKIPGERGEQGPKGPPGMPGPKGETGDIGPKGDIGQRGEKGDEGRMGLHGPRGEKGDIGEAGKDGLPGTPGTHGRPADKGEKGDRGDKGTPGLAGLPASLSSILDATMDPIENAAIVEKLRGFKGERGETGEKGDKGDPGPTGIQGPRGKDGKDGSPGEKGELGPKGEHGHKGDRGEPGPAGEVPASQIALLKGAKGDRGHPGPKGDPGPTGSEGKLGEVGPVGPRGPKGSPGSPGPMGPMGPRGINGTMGQKGQKGDSAPKINLHKLKGEKGERGLRGSPGLPGEAGPQGPPGTCQESTHIPMIGPPGPPGPPGLPGVSLKGPKGDPGDTLLQDTYNTINFGSGDPYDDDDFYSANTVVYRTKRGLIKRTEATELGTLAYVLQEKILLLRVENGWQYVVMGSLMDTRVASTTTLRPPVSSTLRPRSIITSPKPPHKGFIRMVALNEPYYGKMLSDKKLGREGADKLCYEQGKMFKLGGTFKPFLATGDQDLLHIVRQSDRELPVVNLNGSLLFKSWLSIFNRSETEFENSPITILSFSGRSVLIDPNWPNKTIWHGGYNDGLGSANRNNNCHDWRSGSQYYTGVGSSLANNRLLNQEFYTCDNKFIVLCVEVAAYKGTIPIRRKRHHRRHNLFLN